jgi:hypothetical protein
MKDTNNFWTWRLPFYMLIGGMVLLLSSYAAFGQVTNPQASFNGAVQVASPSLWLNYNDSTSSFKDLVSGLTMGNVGHNAPKTIAGNSCENVPTSSASTTSCQVNANKVGDDLVLFIVNTAPGNISSIVDSGGSGAPIFIQSYSSAFVVYVIPNVSTAGNQTVTLNLTTAVSYPLLQITSVSGGAYTSPVDAVSETVVTTSQTTYASTPLTTTVANDTVVGFMVGGNAPYTVNSPFTGESPGGWTGIFQAYDANVPIGSYTFSGNMTDASGYTMIMVALKPLSTSTTSPAAPVTQQPGFDNTNTTQYSAAFPYNSFSVAPNNTFGAVDWFNPASFMVQLDRLNWSRTGSLVLQSKGDLGTCAGVSNCRNNTDNWWQIFLTMSGHAAILCYERNGLGTVQSVSNQVCSNVDIPNGFNYNAIVVQGGTTGLYDLSLYINGLLVGSTSDTAFQAGFGSYQMTVTAGGSGYTGPTQAFTSTGGGANCSVTGRISVTSGVLTTGTGGVSPGPNSGCTSAPTIVLTAPTGTGFTYTIASNGNSSMNSTVLPVYAPGYVSNNVVYGIGASNSSQTSTYLDEFAIFPSALTAQQVANIFYTTKWYQALAPVPSTPPVVILSEDGCADTDNIFAFNMLVRAHQLGLITLAGVDDVLTDGISQAFYRQVLDQAGLNQIPVSVPTGTVGGSNLCTSANITAYNASTSQVQAGYPTASTMYRTIFARYPSTPVYIANGGPLDGIAQFMASGADSISSLTGAQLWTRNGTNGGFLSIQGPICCGGFVYYTYPANQTVLAGNGTTKVYGWGQTPQSGGPGASASRTANDPLWLLFNFTGSDVRSCWDCMTAAQVMFPNSDPFGGGVTVTIGGSGTGYAASTPFTSTGGGTGCAVTGIMVSVGGVPSSILSTAGEGGVTVQGIGSGCYTATSPPTINLVGATGTGVTLTAATTASGCQTITPNGSSVLWSSSSCTNTYSIEPSLNTVIGTPLFTWFINSLVDTVPVGRPSAQ